MKHGFRKIMAVMCAFALVISSVTIYRSKEVRAAEATVGGVTYTATLDSSNITGATVQGFFDAGNPTRLHFGWAGNEGVVYNDLTATISGTKADTTVVNNQSLTVGGQNQGGCFVQVSELATIGAGTYTITVTDGTDKNLVVALTIAQAEELTVDPNYEAVEGNLLLNPAFVGSTMWLEQGGTWTNHCDGSVTVALPAMTGGNYYDYQLVQNAATRGSAFALEAGASYKLKATVTSTNDRKVEVMVQSNGDAGGNYDVKFLDEVETVNATPSDLEYDFTVPANTETGNLNCLAGIMLGRVDNTDAPATTITVSGVSLVKTASAQEEESTTAEPETAEKEIPSVTECKTSTSLSTVGFQIKTNNPGEGVGFRAVFKIPKSTSVILDNDSAEHTISKVGVVYTLDDNQTGNNALNVYSKPFTILDPAGVSGQAYAYQGINNGTRTVGYILNPERAILTKLSSEDPAYDYYAVTMQGISGKMLERTLFVRPFIVDTNNEIVYSDNASVTSVAQVADDLYKKSKMSNEAGHKYLFTEILSSSNTADSRWHRAVNETVDYSWGGSIYTPEDTTATP